MDGGGEFEKFRWSFQAESVIRVGDLLPPKCRNFDSISYSHIQTFKVEGFLFLQIRVFQLLRVRIILFVTCDLRANISDFNPRTR